MTVIRVKTLPYQMAQLTPTLKGLLMQQQVVVTMSLTLVNGWITALIQVVEMTPSMPG
jgi:hypothetical protein